MAQQGRDGLLRFARNDDGGRPSLYVPTFASTTYSAASCATVGMVPATVARRMSRGCDWS
jgi:hypothetical protein